ncbi:transcription factor E2F8-like [Gracilinanus agilis]|uniref:transcription factor E2F8-like n=1 Tax=Gracilinanus agilis TaxID=191870 RepID=UPI001CFE3C9B|nr:transcription factor E2F8-like [Gracilinanus agilis]
MYVSEEEGEDNHVISLGCSLIHSSRGVPGYANRLKKGETYLLAGMKINDQVMNLVVRRASKIRRLYDIANVLSSLELIKKVHVTEERGRKPAFKWTGPEICPNSSVLSPITSFDSSDLEPPQSSKDQCAKNLFSTTGKPNFTRHPSLIKLVKSIENDRRKISSAPSSPIKTNKAESSLKSVPFPSKMAQLAAICKMQLEEQSSELKKKVKMQLTRPTVHCQSLDLIANPEPNRTMSSSQTPSLIQPLGVLPLIHSPLSSAVPVIVPHAHSGTSYAIYLHPSQAQTVTPQNLNSTVHTVPCTNVTGMKGSADNTNSHLLTTKMSTEKVPGDAVKADGTTKPGKALPTPEGPTPRNEEREPTAERCLKRQSMLEDNNSKKKLKEDLKGLENVSATLFPSGYLIPLTQCPSLGTESILSHKENAGACSPNNRIYNSPITGVIPVTTSDLTAVNFPTFHVTPLKLMVSPTSVGTVPVVSSPSLPSSSHSIPVQNPSSAIVNFTLQHLGLISPGVQVSTGGGPGSVPASPRIEPVGTTSDSAATQGKHDSPVAGQSQLNGQAVTLTTVPQPVPVTPKGSQLMTENFFRTPGGPSKLLASTCDDLDGANKASLGPLFVPQRKLEVSTEDVH